MTDEQKLAAIKSDLIQQVQAGLITTTKAQELYSNQVRLIKSTRKNRQAKNMIVLIGSILIGLGIILLGFYNWAYLSQTIKLFIATSWLVLAQVVFYFTIIKKIFFKNHTASIAALYALTVGGSIILTSNTYPLTYNVANALLTWMLLILPTIYIAQSMTIASIYSILLMVWATYEWNKSFVLIIWLLLAIILPFTNKMLEEKRPGVHIFSTILAMSTIVAFVVSMMDYWQGFSLQITMVYIAMIMLIANRLKVKNYFLERVCLCAILAINLFLTFSSAWSGFLGINIAQSMPSNTLLLAYFLITATMMFLVNKIHLFGRLSYELTIIALTPFFVGAATVTTLYKLDSFYSMAIISAYVIFLALATTYDGIKSNSSATLNKGLLVFALLITVRFFDSQMSFQSRAIAFIAVGILFLASNWFLRYRANLLIKSNGDINEDIFAEEALPEFSDNPPTNLVINIEDAVQQIKTSQQKTTTPVSETETQVSSKELPAEKTITIKDLNNISLVKDKARHQKTTDWKTPTHYDANEKSFEDNPLTTAKQYSTPLPTNISEDSPTVKNLPPDKTQIHLPNLKNKKSSKTTIPAETTITIKDLNNIHLPKKELPGKKTTGWKVPTTNVDADEKFFKHKFVVPPQQNNDLVPIDNSHTVKILSQENTREHLPAIEKKPTKKSSVSKNSQTTISDLGVSHPTSTSSGNVKIIADNTPKITTTDTQRFKNINEIKKL